MKKCSKCKVTKTFEEFPKHRRKKDGLDGQCKSCKRKTHRKWYKNNKEYFFKKKYNITQEDYNNLKIEQNYKCKVCLGLPDGQGDLQIDHCHVTGEVRGLLCFSCNAALGLLKDDVRILENAIQYLNKSRRK